MLANRPQTNGIRLALILLVTFFGLSPRAHAEDEMHQPLFYENELARTQGDKARDEGIASSMHQPVDSRTPSPRRKPKTSCLDYVAALAVIGVLGYGVARLTIDTANITYSFLPKKAKMKTEMEISAEIRDQLLAAKASVAAKRLNGLKDGTALSEIVFPSLNVAGTHSLDAAKIKMNPERHSNCMTCMHRADQLASLHVTQKIKFLSEGSEGVLNEPLENARLQALFAIVSAGADPQIPGLWHFDTEAFFESIAVVGPAIQRIAVEDLTPTMKKWVEYLSDWWAHQGTEKQPKLVPRRYFDQELSAHPDDYRRFTRLLAAAALEELISKKESGALPYVPKNLESDLQRFRDQKPFSVEEAAEIDSRYSYDAREPYMVDAIIRHISTMQRSEKPQRGRSGRIGQLPPDPLEIVFGSAHTAGVYFLTRRVLDASGYNKVPVEIDPHSLEHDFRGGVSAAFEDAEKRSQPPATQE